jgi:hypothetical protein
MYSGVSFSQDRYFKGTIISSDKGAPIPYATVGVIGKPIGTVADNNGKFILVIDKQNIVSNDTIAISCVGYEERTLSY